MALILTGIAPSVRQRETIVISIPPGYLYLAPQILGDVNEAIPPGLISLTGVAPLVIQKIIKPITSSTLILTSFAPTTGMSQAISIPSATLVLSGVAPFVYEKHRIASGVLNLTGFAPATSLKGKVTEPIPLANLTLTGIAPLLSIRVPGKTLKSIPPGLLTITSAAPTTYQNGRFVQSIPLATLKLVSFNPSINQTGTETTEKKAGGGPVVRPSRVVIIDGQRKKVFSQGEVDYLLNRFIRKKEAELRQAENHEPLNKKKIKVLKTKITKAQNRQITEAERWKQKKKQIEQENEEILLLLTG